MNKQPIKYVRLSLASKIKLVDWAKKLPVDPPVFSNDVIQSKPILRVRFVKRLPLTQLDEQKRYKPISLEKLAKNLEALKAKFPNLTSHINYTVDTEDDDLSEELKVTFSSLESDVEYTSRMAHIEKLKAAEVKSKSKASIAAALKKASNREKAVKEVKALFAAHNLSIADFAEPAVKRVF